MPDPIAPVTSAKHLKGFLWAAVTVAIFSGWMVVTRFSVTRELSIWDVTALRFGIGAMVLAPAVLRPGAWLPISAWLEGLGYAVLWGVPFVLLVAQGLKLTSAATAASTAPTLMPVFAGLLGWLFLGQQPGWIRWLGYSAILGGLVVLIAATGAGKGLLDPLGMGALVCAALMWAVYTLLFRQSRLTPIQSAALICIWSAILYLPVYLGLGLSRFSQAPAGEIALQAGYQGVLMSAVALVAFNRAVNLLGAGASTAIIATIPALTTVVAVPVLDEVPTLSAAIAIGTIVTGVLLVSAPMADRAAKAKLVDAKIETCS